MRNNTFKYANFPVLKIETPGSAVYPKANIVLCFLNLTSLDVFQTFDYFPVFRIFTLSRTVLQLSLFFRKGSFFYFLTSITNASLEHNMVVLNPLSI